MATNHRDVLVDMAERLQPVLVPAAPRPDSALAEAARRWAHDLVWLPGTKQSGYFAQNFAALRKRLDPLLAEAELTGENDERLPEDLQWMHDNVRLVRATESEVAQSAGSLRRVPHVRTPDKDVVPRVLAIAEDFLRTVDYRYSDHAFSAYLAAFQTIAPLNMNELSLLPPAMKLVVLEEFDTRGRQVLAQPNEERQISALITSMRELSEAPWKELLEPLIVFEPILAADPAKAYARMDFQSREFYRHTVAHYAVHSDCTELEIAQTALEMAQEAHRHPAFDPRLTWRKSHVGYYLVAEGARALRARAGVRLPFGESVQEFIRAHPDEFYLGGIELLTLLIVIAIMTPVFGAFNSFLGRIFAIILLLLPASQS
ncbi:MAG TPA: hypothetical protein VMD98_09325, partial [Bryocella sp.]|nr:hypothetical protein [Bryocella sp.]